MNYKTKYKPKSISKARFQASRFTWSAFAVLCLFGCCYALNLSAQEPATQGKASQQLQSPTISPAQNKRVYQPMGAPADPKVPARWNFYRDYTQSTKLFKDLAAAFPDLCHLESVGKSYGGREMWVLTITNFKTLDKDKELERPAFWIDGGIHANEIQSVDVVLYTAWFLAESYGRNKMTTNLLDNRVFYILPMMSPDSRDAHMHQPNTTHSPRTGQRPYDDDRDGKTDEDGPEDMNKDGNITMMRVKDPNGRYKIDPNYANKMIRCKPGEKGEYTILGQEGFDNDGDGRVNEDGDGYYDPNRDWAWQWQPGFIQYGSREYPFSILENRMAADFITSHTNIAGAQTYHNTGGMILRGPGVKGEKWPRRDIMVYDYLGKKGERMLPGYRYINSADDLYEVNGGEDDWLFVMRGIFAFTNELNTPFNMFREKKKDGEGGGFFGSDDDSREFDKYMLFSEGYVKWQEVDHPQYGKIEIGGKKKNWGRQPPSFMLEEECHRNMAFTLFHAESMPQVEIQEVKSRKLPNGLREITAVFLNQKIIPTRSVLDVQNHVTPPDRATLQGKGIKVVTALISDNRFFEDAKPTYNNPNDLRIPPLWSMKPVYVRWYVEGDGPCEVKLRSEKGGVAKETVKD